MRFASLLALAMAAAAISLPAKAGYQVQNVGFRWLAPTGNYAPDPQYAPPPVAGYSQAPVIIGGGNAAGRAPSRPPVSRPPVGSAQQLPPISPVIVEGHNNSGALRAPTSTPLTMAPSAPPVAESEALLPPVGTASDQLYLSGGQDAVVEGFADDIPLSVALRQIIPPSYVYSTGSGINLSQNVSWRGDKPWPEALQTMLAAYGMEGKIDGNIVRINMKGTESPQMMVEAPPAAVPPTPVAEILPPEPAPAPVSLLDPLPPASPVAASASLMPSTPIDAPQGDDMWRADKGRSLREVLQEWSARSGAELVWSAEYDFPLKASVEVRGSYEDAVRQLIGAFESAQPQPIGRLHDNPAAGQKLLVVETRGNNYGE